MVCVVGHHPTMKHLCPSTVPPLDEQDPCFSVPLTCLLTGLPLLRMSRRSGGREMSLLLAPSLLAVLLVHGSETLTDKQGRGETSLLVKSRAKVSKRLFYFHPSPTPAWAGSKPRSPDHLMVVTGGQRRRKRVLHITTFLCAQPRDTKGKTDFSSSLGIEPASLLKPRLPAAAAFLLALWRVELRGAIHFCFSFNKESAS